MKSKKLSFNFHIALNDIKRGWPLWMVYLFSIFVLVPAPIYLLRTYYSFGTRSIVSIMTDNIIETGVTGIMIFAVFMGFLAPMVVFGYLEKERSCYFFHSIPITRESLFLTKYITGFMMMFIPNLIIIPISVLAASTYDYVPIKELLFLLLCATIADLFFYSFGVLCTMITGQLLAIPVLYGIFLCYVIALISPVNMLAERVYYGIDSAVIPEPSGLLSFLSPFAFFFGRDYEDVYNAIMVSALEESSSGYISEFIYFAVVAIVLTVLMIIAAVLVYKKRKSETANDLMAIGILRPIFRIGVGLSLGIAMAWFFEETFFDSFLYEGDSIRLIIFILFEAFAIIGYLLSEMLMNKSIRIFKAIAKKLAVYIAITAAAAIFFITDIAGISKRVPDIDDFEYFTVYSAYNFSDTVFYSEEDKQFIVNVQKELIESKDEIEDYLNENPYQYSDDTVKYEYVSISYVDKNDNITTRSYSYPSNSRIADELNDFYQKNVIKFIMGQVNPRTIEEIEFTVDSGLFTQITGRAVPDYDHGNDLETGFTVKLDPSNNKAIYEAYCKDLEEGNVTREFSSLGYDPKEESYPFPYKSYNLVRMTEQMVKNEGEILTVLDTQSGIDAYVAYDDYFAYVNDNDVSSARLAFKCSIISDRYNLFTRHKGIYSTLSYLYFNEDCVNVINVLKDIFK